MSNQQSFENSGEDSTQLSESTSKECMYIVIDRNK